MLCDVVRRRRRRRRWAHAPVIHAASHFDHKKRVAWVPISMHTCSSFFYNYGAPLGVGPPELRYKLVKKKVVRPGEDFLISVNFFNKCMYGFMKRVLKN